MVRVRFAPSPTGYIHIGNTRIALFNWLYALTQKGEFILRYDDTDIERSKREYIEGITVDINWLGIKPTETYFQSKRFSFYDEAVEKLKKTGLLYPCYETTEELERRRKIRLSRKLPPIYGRESLKLTKEEQAAFEAEGRKPHWRFLLPNFENNPFETRRTEVHWKDEVRGEQTIDLASMSDPVLVRADGTYLYTLPSVVDDIDMGVTHVIRGDDHVTNTGAQIAIFEALGAKPPIFGHINLLTTASGEGLSKRKGDLSIRSLREAGFEPMAVNSLAALIGTSENVTACRDMSVLAEHFHLDAVSKSAAKFDPADLVNLNRHIVHDLPFEQIHKRLSADGISGPKAEVFWNMIRDNLDTVADAKHWWHVITDDKIIYGSFDDDDRAFLEKAASLLPMEPWGAETWKTWTAAIKDETDRKGKALFRPLRMALTGEEAGPELALLITLMGRDLVLKRLNS